MLDSYQLKQVLTESKIDYNTFVTKYKNIFTQVDFDKEEEQVTKELLE